MISVCLAAFNGARYIRDQIESILASPRVGELIVSDDGSTDATLEIVRAFADPRLRIVAGPRRGPIANFEHLLAQASGSCIFLSDQDDVWLPEKVDVMLAALEHADLAVSDCRVVDAGLAPVEASFYRLRGSGPGLVRNLWRNSYLGCCMAFRREVLRYVLPFPAAVPMHDWWIGLMVDLKGRVRFIEQPLVLYRRHGGNASEAAQVSTASRATQLRWRARMAWALLTRAASA
jgi:GT2 family glycosyltransferase